MAEAIHALGFPEKPRAGFERIGEERGRETKKR